MSKTSPKTNETMEISDQVREFRLIRAGVRALAHALRGDENTGGLEELAGILEGLVLYDDQAFGIVLRQLEAQQDVEWEKARVARMAGAR